MHFQQFPPDNFGKFILNQRVESFYFLESAGKAGMASLILLLAREASSPLHLKGKIAVFPLKNPPSR